ncbi:MAG: c-type cytochrome [Methylococcaceae bacterium]|nr:c-type cytochrome [Methylococcaceae bacterium]
MTSRVAAGHSLYALVFLALLNLAWSSVVRCETPADPTEVEIGRRIYQEGMLSDGSALTGLRFGQDKVEGVQAACMSCHRLSGLGAVEGDLQVSPITGKFLYGSGRAVAIMDPRSGKRFNRRHAGYSDATLAVAIRAGKNVEGAEMNPMMPRYELGERDMHCLTAYLKQLSAHWSPGVDANVIHFATVIAPGVSEERRQALVNQLQTVVKLKNNSTRLKNDPRGRRHMVSAAEFVLGTERKWEWHFWELTGGPETWGEQLRRFQQQQPVFALISGLSETTWQPVHEFCRSEEMPCWFPSVDLPPLEEEFHSVYFSRGVALEADALAHYWASLPPAARPRRVVQIRRDDPIGEAAADALERALKPLRIAAENRVAPSGDANGLAGALQGVKAGEAVMLWLRRADLVRLPDRVSAAKIYWSGQMAGGEEVLVPARWKAKAYLVSPYEVPEKRSGNLMLFHDWMQRFGLKVVDEPLQAQAFFAMDFLGETVAEMLDNLHRDYLLERAESMLSRRETVKSSSLALQRGARGQAHGEFGHNESTTIYPHMGLGVGQRYASKGAYILRFGPSGKPVADSEWIVP